MKEKEGRVRQGVSRRGVLASALAATAGAVAVASMPRSASANDGDPLTLGTSNTEQSDTILSTSTAQNVLVLKNEKASGQASGLIVASSPTTVFYGFRSTAVLGLTDRTSGVGLYGESRGFGGIGVQANADGTGAYGVLSEVSGGGAIALRATSDKGPGASITGTVGLVATTNQGGGDAILGSVLAANVPSGIGVHGYAEGTGSTAVFGETTGQTAISVRATANGDNSKAVSAEQTGAGGVAVVATSTKGTAIAAAGVNGIQATSPAGFAIHGTANDGTGVLGESTNGTGVLARSTKGPALRVEGSIKSTQVAKGQFQVGKQSTVVTGLKVSPKSGVVATLNTGAGRNTYLARTRVNPVTDRVVVVLNKPATRPAKFTVFVVDTV